MALVQISRRLPILRCLSPLARNPGEFVLGIHTSNPTPSGNVSSADKGSASDVKEQPGTPKANNPAASPAAASPAKEGEVEESQTSTSQPFPVVDDEWTEVVHSSGQVYYWNQRTGETTQLGEPNPTWERTRGGGDGGSDGDSAGGHSGGRWSGRTGSRGPEVHVDTRSEAPMEDRTGTYAAMGVVIGAFLGWVSQFV